MTKAEIVKEISEKTGIERAVVENTIEAFMNSIKDHILRKETVSFRGFGNFIVKKIVGIISIACESFSNNISRRNIHCR